MSAREYRHAPVRQEEAQSSDSDDSEGDSPWSSRKLTAVGFGAVVLAGIALVIIGGRSAAVHSSLAADELSLDPFDVDNTVDNTADARYERARIAFEKQLAGQTTLKTLGRKKTNFLDEEEDPTKPEKNAIPEHDIADGSSLKKHWGLYATGTCPKRKAFPPVPALPTSYNGIAWPEMCFEDREESHVFIMGDYGGMTCGDHYSMGGRDPNGWACPGRAGGIYTKTADNTKDKVAGRHMIGGTDDLAQQVVARQMRIRAQQVNVRYALNGGDNFYFGGLDHKCGHPMNDIHPRTRVQFKYVFEKMYLGTDVPFFCVFGNHDFGGRHFDSAWDQQISYTWAANTTGRWIMPAFYWTQRVNYPNGGFSAQYFMVDTNRGDAKPSGADPKHNICGGMNGANADCSRNGGMTRSDCPEWFARLWNEQAVWLEKELRESKATYKVIVTHWPPDQYQGRFWANLHYNYRIDLFVGSHRHTEEVHMHDKRFNGMSWVVVGGGGGITSEYNPDDSNRGRDQYGFMDLSLSKTQARIEAISERGEVRHSEIITPNMYPPILVDEAKDLQKKATAKRKAADAAAEKAKDAHTAAEKTANEKIEADQALAEKTATEKQAEDKLTEAKATAQKASVEQGGAEKEAADKAAEEKAAYDTLAQVQAAADQAAADKDAADKAVEAADDPEEKAAARKTAAEKAAAAKNAAAKVEPAKVAAEKAASAKVLAHDEALKKKDAAKAAFKEVTAAEKAVQSAGSERGAAARLVTKREAAQKNADDKAASAKVAAEKAETDAAMAEKAAAEKAYVLVTGL